MFNNNYSYTEDHEDPYFVGQESWEAFLKSETANLSSLAPPAPGVSEIMYEKPEEVPERMVEEENYVPYDEQVYLRNFDHEFDWSKMKRNSSYKLQIDNDNNVFENERSECTRQNTEAEQEEEETYSISTRESAADRFAERFDGFDNDSQSVYTNANEDNLFDDAALENPEVELEKKVINVLRERPEEERAYIEKIFPMLLAAVKEMFVNHPIPLTDEMVATIVKELLYNKEAMISAERQVLNEIVQEEVEDMRYERPDKMVTEDELNATNRKEKKATKGNRNNSSMNHLNENYVSNIFQFAKRNYPDDKEIQRIGNERNVSAANFRRLTGSRLTDGILIRKAKARIAASGKELVGNVEYWMRDGYFDQCSEREKYIYHKEKALRDLALSGKY